MSAGNIIGWLSPASSKFDVSDFKTLAVSSDQIGWAASLLYLGAGIGPVAFAFMTNCVGRKWINFFAACIYILGWAICVMATKAMHIYIARVIHGVGISFTLCIVPVYVGEIVEDRIRGGVSAAIIMFLSLGILYVYIIGPYVSFLILNLSSFLLPLLSLLSFFSMPESPYFLVMNGRISDAEKNLMRIRGEINRADVSVELDKIIEFIDDGYTRESSESRWKIAQFKQSLSPLCLMISLTFAQSFSGVTAFKSYFETIFSVADSPIDPSTGVIIAEVVAVLVALLSAYYIDKLGRRILFFISSIGCMFCTGFIGLYYALDHYDTVVDSYAWIALVGIYGYQVFFYSGLACLPSVVASEIFPAHLRPWTTALNVMLLSLFSFCVTKCFQIIGDGIGYHYSFWIFSLLLIFPVVYVYFCFPETKIKTFIQIQNELCKTNNSDEENVNHPSYNATETRY